jgi:DNA-binding CsgD family transcriptional regulator
MQVACGAESGGSKTNREIARQLFVSPHTVSAHFSHGFNNVEPGLGSG